ncbi:tannase and feruloyl esterase-domain-containing protein [Copromyces sp. CBS 386.78]|nr:tannase and feruloyl esterase-domain-containing protein [Copromyces sp. CBS 386.78]
MARITASITGLIVALAIVIQGVTVPSGRSGSGWWKRDIPPPASSSSVAQPPEQIATPPNCNKAFFTNMLPPEALLENMTVVPEGGSHGEGKANIAYPTDPTNLAALCAVTINRLLKYSSTTTTKSVSSMADQLLTIMSSRAPGTHYGMATVSSDLGHNGSATDTSWAINQPEKKIDWGWRALHGTVVLGKKLTAAYYNGCDISYSYYSGCSTGGRQGLREIQEFPDSFDGVLVGAPAWWTSHLNNYMTQLGMYNLPNTSASHISSDLLKVVAEEVVRQCDLADGVQDGIISRPDLCAFDSSLLLCPPSNYTAPVTNGTATPTPTCLTRPQIDTLEKVYATHHHSSTQELIYPGLTLGSEAQWFTGIFGGTTNLTTNQDGTPSPYGLGYQRDFLLNNATWNYSALYSDSLVDLADRLDPGAATADKYDISAFKSRGGKIILYHGLADGLVPAKGTELYYNRTIRQFGGSLSTLENLRNTTGFFKFFEIPGMQHCWASPKGRGGLGVN